MSLRINPLYEKLLPQMSEEEFAQLKTSIQEEGQHYPIIANQDLEVLDGHHRFRACLDLGIEPDFEVRHFEDKLIEKKFVIEANLRRRHLNNFQLVELAVPLMEIEKQLAKNRKAEGGKLGRDMQLGIAPNDAKPSPPVFVGKAAEVVAKKVGLSTRTFERGKKILEKASEEDKQQLRDGKVSISRIYQEIVAPEKESGNLQDAPTISMDVEEGPNLSASRAALLDFQKQLEDKQLFCPFCKNAMFECSKCHKTIKDLTKK
jgi:ParB-like chromosome segregation protein Spo0J